MDLYQTIVRELIWNGIFESTSNQVGLLFLMATYLAVLALTVRFLRKDHIQRAREAHEAAQAS